MNANGSTDQDALNGVSSNASFIITSIGDGQSIIYNSGTVTPGTVYPSTGTYSNSNLSYKYSTTVFQKTYSFNYKIVDKLGFASENAATYTINLPYALPVIYSKELSGSVSYKSVNLFWATATEINNSYFEVQRSMNGTDWNGIANVPSYFADGNGSGHDYSYSDQNPYYGTNYYRLNQIDKDGKPHIGNVVNISMLNGQQSTLKLYPNPVESSLLVSGIPADATSIVIYSLDGKLLVQKNISTDIMSVDVSTLRAGIYLLKLSNKNGKSMKSLKFEKK